MRVLVREAPSAADARALGPYDPLLAGLLWSRGLRTPEDAERFLAPSYERDTFDPLLLPGMEAALARIGRAIMGGETIAIWADYDCDGIPAAVVLTDAFRKIGHTALFTYIPHRVREGFGLNAEGIEGLKEKGATLLITVDCGTADVECVALANRLGIDVVVTDHHLPGPELPAAVAIVNPKLPENQYPDDRLCGAGVAWKLASALLHRHGVEPGQEKWLLDMAGLGTIADMVPLLGENRVLAHFGLVVMRKSRRLGLQALLTLLRVDQRTLAEDDLSFSVVPRINAASRMGKPEDAFELLVTQDAGRAGLLARHLDTINNQRKGTVAAIVKEVKKRLELRGAAAPVIVVGDPAWKPSLAGLVAQSLASEYRRPAFVWGREESVLVKGSVRSYGAVNIVELMRRTEGVFVESGGHAFSGGFSVEPAKVHLLEGALANALGTMPEIAEPDRFVEAPLRISDVTDRTYRSFARLAPFGTGNPKPEFLLEGVEVKGVRQFGKQGDHLELTLADGARTLSAIAFFKTPDQFIREPRPGTRIDMVAAIEKTAFGRPGLRLRLAEVL